MYQNNPMNASPPGYGYGAPPPPPPAYSPPSPQPQQGPMIINLGNNNDNSGTHCQICGQGTGNIPRRKAGCVTWAWCICLLLTTGWCCIPFFIDGCKDTELICVKCQTVKQTIPANCCWFDILLTYFCLYLMIKTDLNFRLKKLQKTDLKFTIASENRPQKSISCFKLSYSGSFFRIA